jgi:hypothetical protein
MPNKELQNGILFQGENISSSATARELPRARPCSIQCLSWVKPGGPLSSHAKNPTATRVNTIVAATKKAGSAVFKIYKSHRTLPGPLVR